MLKIKFKLTEAAKSIADEYNSDWSNIPRDIFDQIIAADPMTNFDRNSIGPNAKQLLLPKYKAGETDFINNIEAVKQALDKFIKNRKDYQIKNIAQYPSVDLFVKHINDPENNPIEVQEITKESKIDSIYNKYYKDIDREVFDYLRSLDPTTDSKKSDDALGDIVKNFLLPAYKNGDEKVADKQYRDFVIDNIEEYLDVKDSLPKIDSAAKANGAQDYRDIHSFKSIDDLANFLLERQQNSELLKYLKGTPVWSQIRYIGSTRDHDILEPLTFMAAAYIAGADKAVGGPGIGERGSLSYSSNAYAHWCTTNSGSWDSYTQREGGSKLYDIMAKGSKLQGSGGNGSLYNYQIAVSRSGNCHSDADGWEHWGGQKEYWHRVLSEDPEILTILSKEVEFGGNLPEVAAYKEFKANPENKIFIYRNPNSVTDRFGSDSKRAALYTNFIKTLIIEEGVTRIPRGCFFNWTGLKEIKFPSTLKQIGAEAFKNCQSIELIRFNEGLEFVGAQAFANCEKLHGTITIPNSLVKLDRQVFLNDHVTLSILSDRTEKLQVYPEDKTWYKNNMKLVRVNNEELEEEFINENIPRDLAAAYRDSEHKDSLTNPDTDHGELRYVGNLRRYVRYDYSRAEYRKISSEEALQIIRTNPEDVNKLRIIYDGDLVEYELRDGKFYCLYGNASKPVVVNGREYRNIRYLNPKQLLPYADKIYWTDEYDHIISDDSDIANRRAENKKENIFRSIPKIDKNSQDPFNFISVNPRNADDLDYNDEDDAEDTYKSRFYISYPENNTLRGVRVRDTGAHSSKFTPNYKNYKDVIDRKNNAYTEYTNSRKALINLEKNRDLYDEEEYDVYHDRLAEKKEKAFKEYTDAYNAFISAKKYLYDGWTDFYDASNKRIYKKIIHLKLIWKTVTAKINELKTLENDVSKLNKDSILDDPLYKQATKALTQANNTVVLIKEEIEYNLNQIRDYQKKIEELQARLQDAQSDTNKLNTDLLNAQESVVELEASTENAASEAAKRANDRLSEYNTKIETLKDWLSDNKVKKFSKKVNKEEFADGIEDLLAWVDEEKNTSDNSSDEEDEED